MEKIQQRYPSVFINSLPSNIGKGSDKAIMVINLSKEIYLYVLFHFFCFGRKPKILC